MDLKNLDLKNNDFIALNPELAQYAPRDAAETKTKSKMGNVRTTDLDGEVYDSGKEAEDARNFMLAVRAGEYLLYKHHVWVTLPSGNKMNLDHVLIDANFKVRVYDTKAWDLKTHKFRCTREWKNKAKEFKVAFGFDIVII